LKTRQEVAKRKDIGLTFRPFLADFSIFEKEARKPYVFAIFCPFFKN
jgi:hypothetical protein